MSQPRWSNEEFAAITASHRELVNHWLKSESSSLPNLVRETESVSSSCEEFVSTVKEVRNSFGRLDQSTDLAHITEGSSQRLGVFHGCFNVKLAHGCAYAHIKVF